MRAMRGNTLETVTISTALWVHKKLPQSTVKLVLPSNESYESKTGCNRTPATVLWVPLTITKGPPNLWIPEPGSVRRVAPLGLRPFNPPRIGGSQKGGFQKGGFGGCSPGTKFKPERGYVRQNHPFWKPPSYLPMTLFGVDKRVVSKRVVSKRVVSADVPPERKPEQGYVRQNHTFYETALLSPSDRRVSGKNKPGFF